MARLSTHVLDTARGCPGKGIKLGLYAVGEKGARDLRATATTNDDGRTDSPLLEGAELVPGTYELDFDLGGYFGDKGASFLGTVTVRFNIEAGQNYHVPLLASPYGYTTYRGS